MGIPSYPKENLLGRSDGLGVGGYFSRMDPPGSRCEWVAEIWLVRIRFQCMRKLRDSNLNAFLLDARAGTIIV